MPNYNGGGTKTLLQRRYILATRKEDNDMGYELTKPKLIVDYTVAEQQKKYEFTIVDYPDLVKCKWIQIQTQQSDTENPSAWVTYNINNKMVFRSSGNKKYALVISEQRNGLWESIGSINAFPIVDCEGVASITSRIDSYIAIEPINSLSIVSWAQNFLKVGATIKIYGFY